MPKAIEELMKDRLAEADELRLCAERDRHCTMLYEMDLAIRSVMMDSQFCRDALWDGLQRAVRASQQRLAEADMNDRNAFYERLRSSQRDLEERSTFWSGYHMQYPEYVELCCILEMSPLTQKTSKEMLKRLWGGDMIFPVAYRAIDEIKIRESLEDCISVTVQGAKGGIQRKMHDFGAIGASLVREDFRVYFRHEDEEKAVLFKCSV